MSKKIMISLLVMFFMIGFAVETSAMTDVVMNSAETINPGNFKLGLYPFALLGRNGSGSDFGIAGRAGVGAEIPLVETKGGCLKKSCFSKKEILKIENSLLS